MTKPRFWMPTRKLWWQKQASSSDIHHSNSSMDDEILALLEEVEFEFREAYVQHTKRLNELKEALRERQSQERRT